MNWNRTVAEIGPRLYRYFCASFSQETAADLTQDTLIRLVRKYDAGDYDSAQGSLITYAYGIARLVRLEAWKSRLPEDHVAVISDEISQAENNEAQEFEQALARLRSGISELNETQQQVILLMID